MAWTTPRTWVALEVPTASVFNTDHRDNLREVWHQVATPVTFTGQTNGAGGLTEAAPADIVSTGALTLAAVLTYIEFYAVQMFTQGATSDAGLNLWEVTDLGRLVYLPSGWQASPVYGRYYFTPSAGVHTYKARFWSTAAASYIVAGAGGVGTRLPGYIAVWQKGA